MTKTNITRQMTEKKIKIKLKNKINKLYKTQ